MIKLQSYTVQWLEAKMKENEAHSYDLGEKMVYAFTLLEQLQLKGLHFIFKGGTCLALMFDRFHRFSKDVDIIVSEKPANLTQIFDAVIADSPFLRWEQSVRMNDEFAVPKEHYKFFYKLTKASKYPEQPVLLDIIFVESSYPATRLENVSHPFLDTEEPHTKITIPTVDSIAGDKLTAFAPSTIGVPQGKNKAVEIVKQLFDLNVLYDKIESPPIVAQCFEQTAAMVIKHYKKDYSFVQVYQDIIDTSFVMAMGGKHNPELHREIKSGVVALSQYLSKKTNFGYDKALIAAAKIAWLAVCLMKGKNPLSINWKPGMAGELKNTKIEHPYYKCLNKALKAGYPEAWFYWLNTINAISIVNENKETRRADSILLNRYSLAFIVNGMEVVIPRENPNDPLKDAVEDALEKTGNSGRPLSDWLVKWNDQDLDISKKIGEFDFPKDAKIFISLKSGAGGKQ
jgi:hypothetical protein